MISKYCIGMNPILQYAWFQQKETMCINNNKKSVHIFRLSPWRTMMTVVCASGLQQGNKQTMSALRASEDELLGARYALQGIGCAARACIIVNISPLFMMRYTMKQSKKYSFLCSPRECKEGEIHSALIGASKMKGLLKSLWIITIKWVWA